MLSNYDYIHVLTTGFRSIIPQDCYIWIIVGLVNNLIDYTLANSLFIRY